MSTPVLEQAELVQLDKPIAPCQWAGDGAPCPQPAQWLLRGYCTEGHVDSSLLCDDHRLQIEAIARGETQYALYCGSTRHDALYERITFDPI